MKSSPPRSVPFWTRIVASGPLPGSSVASSTVPWARGSGLAFRSSSSACSRIWSSSSWTFLPVLAEIGVARVVPPNSSSTTPCASRSCFTFCTLAVGRSILLIATTSGTPAFLACEIASIGCGMIASSAATPRATKSVTRPPPARQLLEGEPDDLLRRHLQDVRELGDRDELGHPHQRLLALLLVAPLLLLDLPEARPLLAAVSALFRHRSLDRRQGARDVLGHRLLIHQRLLALLALLPLLAPPLLERNRTGRGRGDRSGRNGHGAAGRGTRHGLGPHRRRDHGPRRGGRGGGRGEGRGGGGPGGGAG